MQAQHDPDTSKETQLSPDSHPPGDSHHMAASAPPKPIPDPHPSSPRRRCSKIARLPREDRELLNIMLRDGAPYSLISEKLAERGHTITVDNVSRWHSGGYKDWVHEQAWLEEMRLRLDFANEVVHQKNGLAIDAASLRIAVIQMYSLLTSFDPATLTTQIRNHPGAYSRILNALCKLTEAGIKCERQRRNDEFRALYFPPITASSPT